MTTAKTAKTFSLDELTTTETEEQELPLVISEILAGYTEKAIRTKTTDLAKSVSNEFAQEYPRVSHDVYKLERVVTLIPKDANEISERFFAHNQAPNLKAENPTINMTLPLVLSAEYNIVKDLVLPSGLPKIRYSAEFSRVWTESVSKDFEKELDAALRGEFLGRYADLFPIHIKEAIRIFASTGDRSDPSKTELIIDSNGNTKFTVKGEWTDPTIKSSSCTIKVPEVPEVALDRITEAQARYFSIIADAKKSGSYKGKTLPQPELYVAWIPTEDQFELKVKVKEVPVPRPVPVARDPALIMRINKQYDHLVVLWDGPNEIPLEGIIKKYMGRDGD